MRSLKLYVLTLMFVALKVLANAQNPVDLITGIQPFGTYHLSNIDSINVANGRMTVDIPLISYPQRGGQLQLNYVVHYHNTGKVLGGTTGCLPLVIGSGCQVFPYDSGSFIIETHAISPSFGCSTGMGTCPAQLNLADGTIIPMAAISGASYRTIDGSGYRLDTVPGYPLNQRPPSPNYGYTLIEPSGIRHIAPASGSPVITEDTNGNQITSAGGLLTDTLGRTIPLPTTTTDYTGCSGPLPISSATAWNPPGINGGTFTIKLCYVDITEIMPPDQYLVQPYYTTTSSQLQSVVLPNGATWTLQYATDGSGNITQITLPTGGTISYTWINPYYPTQPEYNSYPFAVATRTQNANDGTPPATWTYHYIRVSGQAFPVVTIVTDPEGNDIVHTFGGLGVGGTFYQETMTQSYQGSSSGGTLLKTVTRDYQTALAKTPVSQVSAQTVVPIRTTTIWPNGQQSKVEQDWDTGFTVYESTYDSNGNWTGGTCNTCGGSLYGIVTAAREYDFGNGAPAASPSRTISTPSWSLSNQAYLNNNILHLPSSKTILDASNATIASTTYAYDEPSSALRPSGIAVQHDSNPPTGTARGNMTSASKWLNTTNGSLVDKTQWFDTGERYQVLDAMNHATTYFYDPFYAGGYLTQTCNALGQCVSATFDLNTGVMTSFTSENATSQASGNTPGDTGHTITYSYDSILRLTQALMPPDPTNGNTQSHVRYNYSPPNVFPPTVTRSHSITSLDASLTSTYDGLGRPTKTQEATPNGNATVDTVYDALGRIKSVSNPYFSASDPTYGVTVTAYDALGRVTSILRPDGSIAFNNNNGPVTTVMDEAGNQRRSVMDGLGRLIEVDEPRGGPVQSSSYATMQQDGNFVVYNSANSAVWSTGTSGTNAQSIFMQDDGNLVLYIFKWSAGIYATPSSGPFTPQACKISTYLVSGGRINANQCIVSPHGQYMLYMAPDGNFYIYDIAHNTGTWGAGTAGHPGAYATLQADGNFVVYDANNAPLWSSGTAGTYSERLDMEDDGRIIVYKSAWNSGTSDGQFNQSQLAHPGCDVGIGTGWTGVLGPGSCFVSPNGHFELLMQGDGNLTIYDLGTTPSAVLWSTDTGVSSVDPSVAYRTLYAYDALNNLTCVEQHGDASTGTGCSSSPTNDATSPWRVRRFTYDSLSRLLTAKNPESGTISYSYDNDGNLLYKTSPAPNQTSSATETISYCYDALHRALARGYSASPNPPQQCLTASPWLTTPAVIYAYDSGANAIGQLSSISDQAGTVSYTFDILQRLSTETRSLIGANNISISMNLSYDYNLDNSLKALHYPTGDIVTYSPWQNSSIAVSVPASIVDSGHNINYVTGANYNAAKMLTSSINGSGGPAPITNSLAYNKRFQPLSIAASTASQTLLSIGYDFHLGNGSPGSGTDNGNVWSLINYKDSTRTQTFTYDALNRLLSAQNAGTNCSAATVNGKTEYWGNSYSYDAWGNLLGKAVTKCSAENAVFTMNGNNQPLYYSYDAAGNMTNDGTYSYNFDEENRIKGAAGYAYTYDVDGNRVRKSNGNLAGNGTLYWYMTPGIVAETDLAGNNSHQYVFFNGQRIARKDSNGVVYYYFSDHLKSASLIADSSGNIKAESDYYPWGGELQISNNFNNNYKFTGKERDSETQLDYFGARYYSNALSRWMSADWSAKPSSVPYANLSDPQTLNSYSYVRETPETLIDDDGHSPLTPDWSSDQAKKSRAALANSTWKQYAGAVCLGACTLVAGIALPEVVTGVIARNLLGYGLATAPKTVPVAMEIINGASPGAPPLPFGFANAAALQKFESTLANGLERAGANDASAYLTGSAVTGKSYSSGAAFDAGRVSDFDVAIVSKGLLAKAKELGLSLRGAGTRTGPLTASELKALGLEKTAAELSKQSGRPVNFMIYGTKEALEKRGAPTNAL